jgi:AcrR family transcriptional regulator
MSETQEIKGKIIDAAVQMAAEHGWDAVSFIEIAKAAGVELQQVFDLFDDKSDILVALGRHIDARVAERVGDMPANEACRDRLFDILMERFEILNETRDGIVAILHSFKGDPKQAVISLPHVPKSMAKMLELCEVETSGIRGALRVAGLSGLYMKVLCVWMRDETSDMARVMAMLDKDLGRAESVMNFLSI